MYTRPLIHSAAIVTIVVLAMLPGLMASLG